MAELGVNIDHVATVREARQGKEPDPVWAAVLAELGGADGITIHLREDRRHIQDHDVATLCAIGNDMPVNLEMALTEEMLDIAVRHAPRDCCLVPESREELTTEGGLDIVGQLDVGNGEPDPGLADHVDQFALAQHGDHPPARRMAEGPIDLRKFAMLNRCAGSVRSVVRPEACRFLRHMDGSPSRISKRAVGPRSTPRLSS